MYDYDWLLEGLNLINYVVESNWIKKKIYKDAYYQIIEGACLLLKFVEVLSSLLGNEGRGR